MGYLTGDVIEYTFNPWYMITAQWIPRTGICVCSYAMPTIFIGKIAMEMRLFRKVCDYLVIYAAFGIILNGTILGS